jgi:hypothetical protein
MRTGINDAHQVQRVCHPIGALINTQKGDLFNRRVACGEA